MSRDFLKRMKIFAVFGTGKQSAGAMLPQRVLWSGNYWLANCCRIARIASICWVMAASVCSIS